MPTINFSSSSSYNQTLAASFYLVDDQDLHSLRNRAVHKLHYPLQPLLWFLK